MSNNVFTYPRMIEKAVAELQAAQRRSGTAEVVVWAIPTYGDEAGQIVITSQTETPDARFYNRPPAYAPRVIRPSDNRASNYTTWGWVPYGCQYHVMYEAMRREPILPPLKATA